MDSLDEILELVGEQVQLVEVGTEVPCFED